MYRLVIKLGEAKYLRKSSTFYPVRPTKSQFSTSSLPYLLSKFLDSRRQGISLRTTEFYECCLRKLVTNHELTSNSINLFLP